MDRNSIIATIEAEIATLQRARASLTGSPQKRGPGRPPGTATKKKRNLSPERRARIAAAVKARWAKQKKAAK